MRVHYRKCPALMQRKHFVAGVIKLRLGFGNLQKGAADRPRTPGKRQGEKKTIRGAAEDTKSTELRRSRTDFDPEFHDFNDLKNPCVSLFLSPYSLRPPRLRVCSPSRLFDALGVLAAPLLPNAKALSYKGGVTPNCGTSRGRPCAAQFIVREGKRPSFSNEVKNLPRLRGHLHRKRASDAM